MSESEYSNSAKEFSNYAVIHEHDFITISTRKEQASNICSTCGSLYRENSGKLVTIPDKNYMPVSYTHLTLPTKRIV